MRRKNVRRCETAIGKTRERKGERGKGERTDLRLYSKLRRSVELALNVLHL
jgi:hypothetical protein